ncbi:hypothetical protein, partial [Mycobacterium parascrofulaceum]
TTRFLLRAAPRNHPPGMFANGNWAGAGEPVALGPGLRTVVPRSTDYQPGAGYTRWMRILMLTVLLCAAAVTAPSAAAAPLSCADVGGVFVAHGTDGRGDCESADPRHKCHIPPDEQDVFDPTGNYVAGFTMSPPFPGGSLSFPEMVPGMIKGASNADCWKLPPS